MISCFLAKLRAQYIGQDIYGNKYYQDKKIRDNGKQRRWVAYKGMVEATKVPPSWHAWLHYATDEVPAEKPVFYPWQKPHQRNLTGTKFAYKPHGWAQTGKNTQQPDYEAWQPE